MISSEVISLYKKLFHCMHIILYGWAILNFDGNLSACLENIAHKVFVSSSKYDFSITICSDVEM